MLALVLGRLLPSAAAPCSRQSGPFLLDLMMLRTPAALLLTPGRLPCCLAGGSGTHSLSFGTDAAGSPGMPLVLLSLQPGSTLVLDSLNVSGTSSPQAGKAQLPTSIEVRSNQMHPGHKEGSWLANVPATACFPLGLACLLGLSAQQPCPMSHVCSSCRCGQPSTRRPGLLSTLATRAF